MYNKCDQCVDSKRLGIMCCQSLDRCRGQPPSLPLRALYRYLPYFGFQHFLLYGLQAFVISFTSEFIPRMLYQYMYSANGTMHGYTEHSLAYFNISNFPAGSAPTSTLIRGVSMCRSEALSALASSITGLMVKYPITMFRLLGKA